MSDAPEYKFVTYETLDEGTIARIMLDRPDARNAQNRGHARRARRGLPPRRGRRHRARRDPRRQRHDVLVRPRHRARRSAARSTSGPNPHPSRSINGGTRGGRREPDAAGVALLLPEHAAVAQPAQDHHRPGARDGVRGRPDADVGVRPHRRAPRARSSPTSSAPASACAAWSTSRTRGSSAPARPRSSCSPATRSTSTRPTSSAW